MNAHDEIELNINQLHDTTFKKMILYYDDICSSPVEFLVTATLTALSGCIGKNVYLNFAPNFPLHLNIWSVLIGKSTISRKSKAIEIAISDIEEIQNAKYKQWEDKKKLLNDVQNQPKREYLKFPNDSTTESLADILSYSNRGILIASEFGGFLKKFNRNYAGDSKQFLTEIFDVPKSYEITRQTKENKLIIKPYLSILGASTIEWVKENIVNSDISSGFFARFLFSIKNINTKTYIPFLELYKSQNDSINKLNTMSVYKNILSSSEKETILKYEEQARLSHNEYDIESYNELNECGNEELSFKARLLVNSFKIAGIIAITEGRIVITKNDVEDAIFLTNYYKSNIEKLIYSELKTTEAQRNQKRVLDIIHNKGGNVTRTTLMNNSKLKAKELDLIVNDLIEQGKIKETIQDGPTKKGASYILAQ